MASSSKKAPDSRRVKIDQLRAEQKAKERRRSFIFVGIAIVVGLGIIAAAAIPLIRQNMERNRDVSSFGVAAADAGCGDIIDDPTTGESDHVEGVVEYETSPPSSGQHRPFSAGFERSFYTADDTPELEQLVHNLEHGATIVWYDEDVSDEDVSELELLAGKLADGSSPKFIAAAWDSADRGEFPEGNIAIAHWSVDSGHRQYCDRPSGDVINDFSEQFPLTDSPEPEGG